MCKEPGGGEMRSSISGQNMPGVLKSEQVFRDRRALLVGDLGHSFVDRVVHGDAVQPQMRFLTLKEPDSCSRTAHRCRNKFATAFQKFNSLGRAVFEIGAEPLCVQIYIH
jgi:hypothetical protein